MAVYMADRMRLSRLQLEAYFDRVCLPVSARVFDVTSLDQCAEIQYLNLLLKHHLVKVPWENLDIHYSWHHVVNTDQEHVFEKVVQAKNGRGGYCFETNSFFCTVLLSLGFKVYMTGSRIFQQETKTFGGWTHTVTLLTIAGCKYLIDVGFGANGPTTVLPLSIGCEQAQIVPSTMRLTYEPIAQNLDQSQSVWLYQYRIDGKSEWETGYSFVEIEFTLQDLEAMNLYPWTSRHSFFTHKVVAVRFTTAGETLENPIANEQDMDKEIEGTLILSHDVLKWRRNGLIYHKSELRTEKDRLTALQVYFGIQFSKKDQLSISGTAAELKLGEFTF